MAAESPYSLAAVLVAVAVFFVTATGAALGLPVAGVALVTVVELLKPTLVYLTIFRVVRSPPEGAGQLRALFRWLRTRGEADVSLGPVLLVAEVVAAAVALAGFAAVFLFADFAWPRPTVRLSLAVVLGYADVYRAGSVAALVLYSTGVVAWTGTWVLEGLDLTATKPAPFRE